MSECGLCDAGDTPIEGEHRLPTWEPVICARSEVVLFWIP